MGGLDYRKWWDLCRSDRIRSMKYLASQCHVREAARFCENLFIRTASTDVFFSVVCAFFFFNNLQHVTVIQAAKPGVGSPLCKKITLICCSNMERHRRTARKVNTRWAEHMWNIKWKDEAHLAHVSIKTKLKSAGSGCYQQKRKGWTYQKEWSAALQQSPTPSINLGESILSIGRCLIYGSPLGTNHQQP